MHQNEIYPYVIEPKLAPAIWGGGALVATYGKKGAADAKIGESWECWDENRVHNGPLAGQRIADLRGTLGTRLLGDLDPKQIFPILTKFIDAREALSVQVHPDDAYARRVEHQRNGKTECWYILQCEAGAELVLGWSAGTDRAEYERRVADGSLGDILRRVPVKPGEAFYLPAGTLHAIGKGIVLFETQQASDLTYRIFDWNRTGADGKPRELHVQKAGDVLDYRECHAGALEEVAYTFEGFVRTALIADPHFLVERVTATETPAHMLTHGRPLVITNLGYGIELVCEEGRAVLEPFQTALIPAAANSVCIAATQADSSPFMCVTPPTSLDAVERRLRDAGVAHHTIERFMRQFKPNDLRLQK